MNSCFSSVIFTENLPFFPRFLKSLEQQTDQDFTLLLFNHGVNDLQDYLRHTTLKTEIINIAGRITEARSKVIQYLKQSTFDNIIFGDTDDFFPENRVEVNKQLLKQFHIVANDICLVDKDGNTIQKYFWSERLELLSELTIESILDYNFLGLGITTVRKNALPHAFIFPKDVPALDWYLFSLMMLKEPKTCFTSKTFVYYRQHDGNSIGLKHLTLQKLRENAQLKHKHYTLLSKHHIVFEHKLDNHKRRLQAIENMSELEFAKYKTELNTNLFWWEGIKI